MAASSSWITSIFGLLVYQTNLVNNCYLNLNLIHVKNQLIFRYDDKDYHKMEVINSKYFLIIIYKIKNQYLRERDRGVGYWMNTGSQQTKEHWNVRWGEEGSNLLSLPVHLYPWGGESYVDANYSLLNFETLAKLLDIIIIARPTGVECVCTH